MTQSHVGLAAGEGVSRHTVPLTLAGLLLLAAASGVAGATPAGAGYVVAALLGYLPMAAVVVRLAPHHRPHQRFGAANWATLLRAALAGLAAGLLVAPEALTGQPEHAWLPCVLVGLGLLLDLVDGRLARHQGLVSEFGARFDVEVDAWTALVLAAMTVRLGAAPAWALAIGLSRYLFLAAGTVLPALAAPLPASLRRRLIGGSATLALGALLVPPMPVDASTAIAAGALAALLLSFSLDTVWLLRRR